MIPFQKLLTLGLLLSVWPVHAESLPRGLATDARVKLLSYNASEVYKLVAYYGYQIDIQIGDAEEIKTIAAGDSVGWQIVGSGQHVFIKPMARDARTNLSLVTSKRTYIFDLSARSPSTHGDITYLVRFRYPETQSFASLIPSAAGKDGPSFNLDYRLAGSTRVRPLHVFDDGQFTYFEFDPKRELPAIFVVGGDGKESLVNYRMEGQYAVVERLGDFYTMRNGKEAATAINQRKFVHGWPGDKETPDADADAGK
jgi:type IV secretion system protein VirB9